MNAPVEQSHPSTHGWMQVTIHARSPRLEERLRTRLDRVASLRCNIHGRAVTAVAITAFEDGWFDSRCTTCCEDLTAVAASIIGNRY